MKVAITGGATGIGAALVGKMKAAGHHVTAFDIHEPQIEIDCWIKTDLSDENSINSAIEKAQAPFDALINNAGIPPREGMAETILLVNFFGFRSFLEGMLEKLSPGAAIVNTASRAGAMWPDNIDEVKALLATKSQQEITNFTLQRNIGHIRAYNLSKEAVIVYTIAKTEHMIGRGLRMNSVSPAAVSTGILGDFKQAFGEKVAKNINRAGRAGNPEEIADAIIFMAGQQSAWLKGVDLIIDGGVGAMARSDMLNLSN